VKKNEKKLAAGGGFEPPRLPDNRETTYRVYRSATQQYFIL